MKKVVSSVLMLSLVSVMLFGLVGCGQKNETTLPDSSAVVDTDNNVTDPTVPPEVDSEPEPEVEPIITVSLDDIVNTIKNAYGESYLPNMQVEPDVFNELTGLTSEDYIEYFAEMPMISAQVDTLFVVKATEDNIGKVAEKLTSYRDMLLHDSFQYPANMPKIEASVVEVYDDYVVFMMLGDMFKYPTNEDGSVKDVEDSGVLDFYANETKKGLDALAFLFDNGYVEPVVEDTNETDVVNEVEEPEGNESIVMNEDNNASDSEIEKESVEPIGEVENTESSASDFS